MKSYKQHKEELTENEMMLESIGIVDGQLVFDYTKLAADTTEISSKFGKKDKGEKFVPYQTTTETIIKHKVFSVYSAQGENKTELLKAIKRHKTSNVKLDNEDYAQFINRTSMYIDYKFLRKYKIETIIAPHSSSMLIEDILHNVAKRNSKIQFITKSFEKSPPKEIIIDRENPKISPDIIKYLESRIKKAEAAGYFEMKEIKRTQLRKFISNFMKLTPDISLRNNLDGKNVILFDDIVVSGNTTAEMIRNLEMYSPESVMALTLFKTA